MHENEEIKESKFFKISHFNQTYQLEICEVYPEDEGTYKIVASNSLGETSSSANLNLDSKFKGCRFMFTTT